MNKGEIERINLRRRKWKKKRKEQEKKKNKNASPAHHASHDELWTEQEKQIYFDFVQMLERSFSTEILLLLVLFWNFVLSSHTYGSFSLRPRTEMFVYTLKPDGEKTHFCKMFVCVISWWNREKNMCDNDLMFDRNTTKENKKFEFILNFHRIISPLNFIDVLIPFFSPFNENSWLSISLNWFSVTFFPFTKFATHTQPKGKNVNI